MHLDLPADHEAFKEEILTSQTVEVQCVYEVWWAANSRYPDLPVTTRLAVAESVVRDLIKENRVTLVRGVWAGYDFEHEPVSDQHAALLAHGTWDPDPDKRVVWMCDRCPDCPGRKLDPQHEHVLPAEPGREGRQTGSPRAETRSITRGARLFSWLREKRTD